MTQRKYELIFGVNHSEVAAQLAEIDKSLKETQKEAKLLKTSLSQGWDTKKWVEAKQTASKAVEDTAKKAQLLRERLREMAQNESAETQAEQFAELRRELMAAENAAAKARQELKKIDTLRLDNLKKELEGVAGKLNKVGKNMTIGLTTPIVAAGAASVKAYSDMYESLNKVDEVFGDAATSVEKFANTTLTQSGIAKSTALDMAAGYGDMATSMGFAQDEAAEMSTKLVQLAGDLASFKNMSLDQVNTALTGIFTGESESLKKLGVVIKEETLQEYAQANGITKKVSAMSQAEQVSLRYQYAMEHTRNSQGDFARTADSTANQIRILQESLKELAAIAGEELAPMVTPIISKLSDCIKWLGSLDDGTKEVITKAATFAAVLGPLVTITGKVTGGVSTLVGTYKTLKTAATGAKTAQTALNVAQAASPAGALATAIGLLVSVLGSAAITAALTSDKTETLAESVKAATQAYDDACKSIDDTRTKSLAELTVVEDQLDRYGELNGKVGDSAAKKEELARIVENLNKTLGTNISTVNEETGEYDTSTEAIRNNIQARKDLIEAQAYEDKALEAKKQIIDLQAANGGMTIEQAQRRISDAQSVIASAKSRMLPEPEWTMEEIADWWDAKFGGTTGKEIIELQKYINQLEQLQAEYDKYTEKASEARNKGGETGSKSAGEENWASGFGSSGTDDAKKKIEEERSLADYQYKMGEIGLQQYMDRLRQIRNANYAAGSKEYRDYTLEIKSLQDTQADEAQKASEDATNRAQKALEERISNERSLTDYQYKMGEIDLRGYVARLQSIRDAYYVAGSANYRNYTLEIKSLEEQAGKEEAERAEKELREKIASERSLADYQYKMGEIDLEAYIARVRKIRDAYYKQDTDDYRDYTLEIKSLSEQLAEQETKKQEERLSAAKEATNKIIDLAQEEADAKIAAIDAELAARKELQEEKSAELRLQQAMAQLAFTRDEESRESLEREIGLLKKEASEKRIEKDADLRKENIRAGLDRLKAETNELMERAQQHLAPDKSQNEYIQRIVTPNITVNASGLTEMQAKKLVMDVYNEIMYGR